MTTDEEQGSEQAVTTPLCRIARNQARLAALGIHEAVQGLGVAASTKRCSSRQSVTGLTAAKAFLVQLSWIELYVGGQHPTPGHPQRNKRM